jgi:hypothetical protein
MIATIEIKNQFKIRKKKIQVLNSITGMKDIVFINDSIVLPIPEGSEDEDKYIEIQIISDEANIATEYIIEISPWINFQILSKHRIESSCDTVGSITKLRIPDGMHDWKLRISKPTGVNITSNAIICFLEGGNQNG